MSRYDGKDVYCYDNSNVLINKLNITDEKELEEKERKISLLNTILLYEEVDIQKIKFDIKFYKQIHKTFSKTNKYGNFYFNNSSNLYR